MSLAKYSGKKEAFIEGAKDSKLPRKVRWVPQLYRRQVSFQTIYLSFSSMQNSNGDKQHLRKSKMSGKMSGKMSRIFSCQILAVD